MSSLEGAPTSYLNEAITSLADMDIKDQLDRADATTEKHPELALEQFESILKSGNPDRPSPRALFGRGQAHNILAEKNRSNWHLEQAILSYQQVIEQDVNRVPEQLYLMAGEKCVDRMQFRGWNSKAVQLLKKMLKRLPERHEVLNMLGTQFLIMGQNTAAQEMFEAVLSKDKNDAHACLHLGFVLKAANNQGPDLERGVELLSKGIKGSNGSADSKFYYHLGEGLRRLGKQSEADQVYKEGVELKKFISFWQRSLYNVEGLKSQPVWKLSDLDQETKSGLEKLVQNWEVIRDEALALLDEKSGLFQQEAENLKDGGDWTQLELFRQGRQMESGCKMAPRTCSLLNSIRSARTNKRGQAKFSVMKSGTHVHAHSGPTNCRLRAHLGLKVPKNPKLKLRVADQNLTWKDGEMFIFDDSFDHEVWFPTSTNKKDENIETRVILIVDIWHPDLDEQTRQALTPI